jgi:hypothetical protein
MPRATGVERGIFNLTFKKVGEYPDCLFRLFANSIVLGPDRHKAKGHKVAVSVAQL